MTEQQHTHHDGSACPDPERHAALEVWARDIVENCIDADVFIALNIAALDPEVALASVGVAIGRAPGYEIPAEALADVLEGIAERLRDGEYGADQ